MPLGVIEYNDDGLPKCEICGEYYSRIGTHVRWKHSMTAKQYKDKFGLIRKRGICSKNSSLKTSNAILNHADVIKKNLIEKSQPYWYKKGHEGRRINDFSAQELIENTERCPEMTRKNIDRMTDIRMESIKTGPLKSLKERIAIMDTQLYYDCIKICQNTYNAYDLKQETIFAALTSDYDERGNLHTWLYAIAQNIFRTNTNKEKRLNIEFVASQDMPDVAEPENEPEPEIKQVKKGIDFYINQLNDKDKKIFRLRYISIP